MSAANFATKKIMLDMATKIDIHILKVIRIATQIDRHNVNLQWLKSEISMATQMDPMLLTNKIKSKMLDFKEQILNRDEDFFKTSNAFMDEKYIKNDERKEFMINFVKMIQSNIEKVSEDQKKNIWDALTVIVNCVIEFRHADPRDPYTKA